MSVIRLHVRPPKVVVLAWTGAMQPSNRPVGRECWRGHQPITLRRYLPYRFRTRVKHVELTFRGPSILFFFSCCIAHLRIAHLRRDGRFAV
jgi:hypothetical protein